MSTDADHLRPSDLLRLFPGQVNLSAPLVRFSKLPWRAVVAEHSVHVTHTPMMLAGEFSRSDKARSADFSTCEEERRWHSLSLSEASTSSLPLVLERKTEERVRFRSCVVAQFAAENETDLANAAELISPYVDGIDLNCGCPQNWAYRQHIGSYLLRKPEIVAGMVRAVKRRVGEDFNVSVKIRVDTDPKCTEVLVSNAIAAGADYITIHGRTRTTPSTAPVDLEAIAQAGQFVNSRVPFVANGDIWSYEDVVKTRQVTGAQGIMAARGLLNNPALFDGADRCPMETIRSYQRLAADYGSIFPLYHRTMSFMLADHLQWKKSERIWFNTLSSHKAVSNYMANLYEPHLLTA